MALRALRDSRDLRLARFANALGRTTIGGVERMREATRKSFRRGIAGQLPIAGRTVEPGSARGRRRD
jgi:hypothetical protein